ncbi:MAG: 5'-deoxynucleotidase, partial [Eubacterium sp.]|nr:5'-deoxynucleotidase [Eubacterium sp.]
MSYNFFAAVSRMKYIERWALMRNSRAENLSEHSLEVAMIAHALCTIGNVRYERHLDAEKAALVGLYHDASEIITGDMPTPVKYYSDEIRDAYKKVEAIADKQLLDKLPEDLRGEYEKIFCAAEDEDEKYMRRLV